jgi:hypothetical protein
LEEIEFHQTSQSTAITNMSNQHSNQTGAKKPNWPTIIIVGIIVLSGISYINKKLEQHRQAEIDRQNAEAVGAFVGGALREMTK